MIKIGKRAFDYNQIMADAPTEEPARQYYFMDRTREVLEARFQADADSGKALEKYGEDRLKEMAQKGVFGSFSVQTFGCQMNEKDSEKLIAVLEKCGLEAVNSEQADMVLYNTCTVRENANQKLYGHLGYVHSLKKKNPDMIVALCGCMMQEEHVVEKLKKSYRFVDLIFGTHNIFKLAELLFARLCRGTMEVDIWDGAKGIVEDLPAERKYPFKSGVNIMFGCNNFCSYCIVPYVRGRERSREPEEIIREIQRLAADGVKEVMLLGQNVNSYGKTLKEPISFARLLEEVEKIEGIQRIRFMTSHPKDLSDDLIRVMRDSKKICRHLHLPVQSGSTRILTAMNRRYTKEQYLALAEKIQREIPGISLTTDIIVGFPGETEEDFEDTLDVVRKVRFDSAFTFLYSKRTGTPAASMENQVPEDVAKARFDRLLAEVQKISSEVCGRDAHTVQSVLVEEEDSREKGWLTGRLGNNITVHFPGDVSLIGQIVNVYLEEARGFYYTGRLA